jgi:hypothetical protein
VGAPASLSDAPVPGSIPAELPLSVGFPSHTRLLTYGTIGASGTVQFCAESLGRPVLVVLSLSSPHPLERRGAASSRHVKRTPRNSSSVGHVKGTPRTHFMVGMSSGDLELT